MEALYAIIALVVGAGGGWWYGARRTSVRLAVDQEAAELSRANIIADAETKSREILLQAKDQAIRIRDEAEQEGKRGRKEVEQAQEQLNRRREKLDDRLEQTENRARKIEQREKQIDTLEPVSYTHLDVYKRQGMEHDGQQGTGQGAGDHDDPDQAPLRRRLDHEAG